MLRHIVRHKRLRCATENRRQGMMTSSVCLWHDNTRAHNVRATQQLLQSFNWEVLDNPSYSPDIASSDLRLFVHLKKCGQPQISRRQSGEKVVIACAGGMILALKNVYPIYTSALTKVVIM